MSWLRPTPSIRTGEVLTLARAGALDEAGTVRALQIAGRTPTPEQWPRTLLSFASAASGALMVAGIICVVAFNWQTLGRWGRFGMAQAVLVAVFGAALWFGLDRRSGKALLTIAIALIGPLLALFGQTYQTGADTYELFKVWALLAIPWLLASRFAGAWLLWLALIETAVVLYFQAFNLFDLLFLGRFPPWLLACLFHAAALVLWELAAYRFDWLRGRLGPRVLAFMLLGLATLMTILAIFGIDEQKSGWGALLWALALGAGWYVYRMRSVELGMLAMGWLSITTVLVAGLLRISFSTGSEMFGLLLSALVLIGAGTLGRQWFQKVAREERS